MFVIRVYPLWQTRLFLYLVAQTVSLCNFGVDAVVIGVVSLCMCYKTYRFVYSSLWESGPDGLGVYDCVSIFGGLLFKESVLIYEGDAQTNSLCYKTFQFVYRPLR